MEEKEEGKGCLADRGGDKESIAGRKGMQGVRSTRLQGFNLVSKLRRKSEFESGLEIRRPGRCLGDWPSGPEFKEA